MEIGGPKSGSLSLQKKGNKNPPTSIKKLGVEGFTLINRGYFIFQKRI